MSDPVLETIRVVVVAVLVLVGQRGVAKWSKQANDKTAQVADRGNDVADRANDIEGMDRLVHNLQTRLEKVEERADKLASRVQILEEERVRDKSLIRHLIDYAHTLRDALRSAGMKVPEPPAGLDFDGGPFKS